jgi:transposase
MITQEQSITSIELQTFYPADLQITEVAQDEQSITINLKSRKHSHPCSECGQLMHAYHATYKRKAQDLPILGKNVTLVITAYEYSCSNESCKSKTCVEDYEGFLGRSGRMTGRLEDFIRVLALETNCEGAAAICKEMGVRVSGDTIIRMIRKLVNVPLPSCGETIGVDDFAYRKGQTYCTVICDGETHRPIEVLKGRDGEELRKWLEDNKHVKRVARDRASAYAKAISDVLPDAMQVADRFHLHQNLLHAVKDALRIELPNQIKIENPQEPMSELDLSQANGNKKNASM